MLSPIIGVLFVAFSLLLSFFAGKIVQRMFIPRNVALRGHTSVWKFTNTSISFAHALLIGLWDILSFIFYPELLDEPTLHVVPFTYIMVCLSTGYFIYDCFDILWSGRAKKEWPVLLHHFAVVSAFLHNVLTLKCIGYTAIALFVEVNTIFLHLRKLMQLTGVNSHGPVFRINAVINLVTFAACRGYSLSFITWGIYQEPEKLTAFFHLVLCVSMFIMDTLNPIFFYILLRNDFLLKTSKNDDGGKGDTS